MRALLLAFLAVSTAAAQPPPGSAVSRSSAAAVRATSPAEVRQEFDEICRRFRNGEDRYFGNQSLARIEDSLAAPGLNDAVHARLLAQAAHEHLHQNRVERAIELFTEALPLAAALSPELRVRLRRDLALAELRRAEQRNCVHHHRSASCLYPIRAGGVHLDPDPARRAAELYEEVLRADARAVQPRWLLQVTRMLTGEFPGGVLPELRAPESAWRDGLGPALWSERAADVGLDALDLAGGAVVDDFDGDGHLDVVTSTMDPCDHAKAFRNRGDGTFEDVSSAWGLDAQLGGLNLVHADYDNDGRPDLLILRGGWLHDLGRVRNSLLRNDLQGPGRSFLDVTLAAGIAYPAYPTQTAAWADYDGDGWLDLYIGNETAGQLLDPSQLFRNQGDGTFANVSVAAGVVNFAYAKAVAWGDYDNDGRPDLYVSNFGAPNRLYHNRGDGTFADVARAMGVEAPEKSFATWFFDYDNDGRLDLFVADYGTPYEQVSASYLGLPTSGGRPALYHNEGARFRNVAEQSGFARPLLPMGANYGELDNDGWPDLYLGTGIPDLEALMPNVMMHNLGGERFDDITFAGGFGHLQKGHGIGFADFNDDGQPEVFAQMGGFYPVDAFYNAFFVGPGNDNAWLQLELVGTRANRRGQGARIAVDVVTPSGSRRIHSVVASGGSFGGSPLRSQIGLGDATAITALEVAWPGSGTVDRIEAVAPRRRYRLVEGAGTLDPLPLEPFAWPQPTR